MFGFLHRRAWLISTVLLSAAGLLSTSSVARADLVSVASVGTVGMLPNTQSGFVNVNLFDANPGIQANLYGWSVGLRVVGIGTAGVDYTGTVTIDSASMTYAPNPILTNPFPGSLPSVAPTDPNVNQPSPGDVTVYASDAAFNSVVVPGTQRGMVSVKFNASNDAAGNFALQLVDSGGLSNTYWTDSLGDNYAFNFAGSPIVGTGGVQIGTLSLPPVPAAVPEPSSLLLAGGLAGIASWKARRKRLAAKSAATVATAPTA